jgi:hypothetical protein
MTSGNSTDPYTDTPGGQQPSYPQTPAGQQPGYPPPGYPPPSPSYPQQYPGQQSYPTQQPYPGQQPYPTQQPYPGQQPYPTQQPYPGQQLYPGQQSYPPPGYPQQQPPTPAKQTGPLIGVIAFLLAAAATVLGTISLLPMTSVVAEAVTRVQAGDSSATEWMSNQLQYGYELSGLGFNVATALGFAALITGIVAIVKRSGRSWGVGSVLLAIAGPFIAMIVLVMVVVAGVGG